MKKLLILLITTILVLTLSGCNIINDLVGKQIKLEEDQIHMVLTEDGKLSFIAYFEDQALEDAFDINFKNDEDEIIDDLQDAFDDSVDLMDQMNIIKTDIEVTSFKKDNDYATLTVEYEDFELMFSSWFETFENLADTFGDYESLANSIDFILYKDEEKLDEDDLDHYEDGFAISLYGGDDGVYYEFPYEILIIDDQMDYERISETIIFVEDNESGYVVLDGNIDCEPTDVFGNSMIWQDIIAEENSMPENPVSIDTTDVTRDDLQLGERHKHYASDGSLVITTYMSADELTNYFGIEFLKLESEISDEIVSYYKEYYAYDVIITSIDKRDDGVYYSFYVDSAIAFEYYTPISIEDTMALYSDFDDFSNYYSFMLVESDTYLQETDLQRFGNDYIYYIDGGTFGTYYTLPGNITLADYYTIETVEENTVYVEAWTSGIIAIE